MNQIFGEGVKNQFQILHLITICFFNYHFLNLKNIYSLVHCSYVRINESNGNTGEGPLKSILICSLGNDFTFELWYYSLNQIYQSQIACKLVSEDFKYLHSYPDLHMITFQCQLWTVVNNKYLINIASFEQNWQCTTSWTKLQPAIYRIIQRVNKSVINERFVSKRLKSISNQTMFHMKNIRVIYFACVDIIL